MSLIRAPFRQGPNLIHTRSLAVLLQDAVFSRFWRKNAVLTPVEAGNGGFPAAQPPNMKTISSNVTSALGMLLASSTAVAAPKVNAVDEGKKIFESMGCMVCHATDKNDASAKTGPNLHGLFLKSPRRIAVKEESGIKEVKADKDYFMNSVRSSWDQLAIAESGPTQGSPYPQIMPSFPPNLLADEDLEFVWHYLRTLAEPGEAGPPKVMMERRGNIVVNSLLEIPGEVVVTQRPLIARVPVLGSSGRAVHVGLPGGMNYTFDPRLLAVRRVWSGGFINRKAELSGRAGEPSTLGHQAVSVLRDGELPAPLTASGAPVDFEFKEPDVRDDTAAGRYLHDGTDFLDQLAALDAEYLGHRIDAASGHPCFRFRVGKNVIEESIALAADGTLEVVIKGRMVETQRFRLGSKLAQATVAGATLKDGILTLQPSAKESTCRLSTKLTVPPFTRIPAGGEENRQAQALVSEPAKSGPKPMQLQAGYSAFTWQPPLDLFGRPQIFEPTGIAVAKDGTIVISTRTSGIWRIRDQKWTLFAEGIFDSLGVCIEDEHGEKLVVGQKPELTRVSDVDGDGRADHYDTLCDDFGFHANYHEYLHGPVRDADGNYYFNLNLDHNPGSKASWGGGAGCMGTMGGFRGWCCRVTPAGKFEPFAPGLRSPAGIGVDPKGRLWYAENQGDYVGSSKMVPLEQGKFYGHMAGLVDLPGMTPKSPELNFELWKDKRRKAAVILPHRKLSNSPGNPVWELTGGRFGPYQGQMIVGDQTLSSLMRVVPEQVDGQDQGCAIPFAWGFSSGVMRPCFLPDGSLLLGQTGRGWGAMGGQIDSLQQLVWDGSSKIADILAVKTTPKGFDVNLTQPLLPDITAQAIAAKVHMRSWFYTDEPRYGSPEYDERDHPVAAVTLSEDRRVLHIALTGFGTEGPWLGRVHHLTLHDAANLFAPGTAWPKLEAYITLHAIPAEK